MCDERKQGGERRREIKKEKERKSLAMVAHAGCGWSF